PVVLKVESDEMLRVHPVGIHRSTSLVGQTEQERSERRADARAARRGRVLPRPVAVEIILRLDADASIGLLQHPVFRAIPHRMVALAMRQRGRPRVIGIALISAGLRRAEIAREARDTRERGLDQLRSKAGAEPELRRIEARALIEARLLVAVHAV